MYAELYQYLIQNKELPVPGIGTFLLERKSAVVDFPNRLINPPAYTIDLQSGSYVPGERFFNWLGSSLGTSDREAVFRFNEFAFDMKKQISDGAVIIWDGVGTLNRGLGGEVKFQPGPAHVLEKPVPAEKVIREKAEHMVRVGEDDKTSVEMSEMLGRTEEKKSYWWAMALAVALLAVIFLGWYFSEHGIDANATSNSSKVVPADPAASYNILQ